jgi:glycine cleavage system aminomethyltransferase T
VPVDLARDGATFEVRVDGGSCAARVVERPLHDPEGRRVRA